MNPTDPIANPEETNGADISTIQPRFCGEWVSVKDELPIEAGEYLILTDHGTFYKCNYRGIEFLRYDRSTIRDITHWLRLYPQPPLPEVKEDECMEAYNQYLSEPGAHNDEELFRAGWNEALKKGGRE